MIRRTDARRRGPGTIGVSPEARLRLDRARLVADRDHARPITVGQMAAAAGFSRFHFIRLFRGAFGLTPHQYLKTRRLERAKDLLAFTSLSVTRVALEVGFQSLGSFSREFRIRVGESPAAYRAAHRRPAPFVPHCFVRMFRAGAPAPGPASGRRTRRR